MRHAPARARLAGEAGHLYEQARPGVEATRRQDFRALTDFKVERRRVQLGWYCECTEVGGCLRELIVLAHQRQVPSRSAETASLSVL